MPGLVACNRRWNIGGDDLVLPAFFELLIRGGWLIAISIVHFTHAEHDDCPQSRFFHLFITGEEICLGVICIVSTAILVTSARGTIVNVKPRRHLPFLLYVRSACQLAEIGWNVMGCVWLYRHEEQLCEQEDFTLLIKFTVILNWILLLLLLVSVYIVVDAMGARKYTYKRSEQDVESSPGKGNWYSLAPDEKKGEILLSTWKTRIRIAFCCLSKKEAREAYLEVAKVWATLFEDKDIVVSDILAGIIMLARQTAEESKKVQVTADGQIVLPYHPARKEAICLKKDTGHPWMNFKLIHHYIKYAYGIYGCLLYTLEHGLFAPTKLCKHIKCCACCVTSSKNLSCDWAAFKEVTGVKDEDVVYITYHNRVYQCPFAVVLDHETKSVVVAIRGSLSLRDVLTDMTGHCELLVDKHLPKRFYCHLGMLSAARYIKDQLEEKGCLTKAFELQPSYTLVICGHSLGGGAAALLGVLLKPTYPKLRCFTYGTPSIVSHEAAVYMEPFVLSVIYGDDVCPRMNVQSVVDVNTKIFALLSESRVPKYRIILGGSLFCCHCKSSLVKPSNQDSKPPIPTITIEPPPLEDDKTEWKRVNGSLGSQCVRAVTQCVPGKIVHITKIKKRNEKDSSDQAQSQSQNQYQAHWVQPSFFREIYFKPKMVIHHFPNLMERILSRIMEEMDETSRV